MLDEEITDRKRLVRTDAYQMSIGEILTMYQNAEIIIDPEFQRLFRWDIGQKSKLIESLLLGIPLPSIFVFEKEDGKWELIDGLQRISSILEFIGALRDPEGSPYPPSILVATKYLPSLHNTVWEKSDHIKDVDVREQNPLSKPQQLAIRRGRLGVEILKRPSSDQTKYDLFQRLNAGGTQANYQELRNCIVIMVNGDFFRAIKNAVEHDAFKNVTAVSEEQLQKQRHLELAMRFLVHTEIPYDGKLDVEEFIDDGIVRLAQTKSPESVSELITETFQLLDDVAGSNALRRFDGNEYTGRVLFAGLEGIAVGVAKNLAKIKSLGDTQGKEFLKDQIQQFWMQDETGSFTANGLRGTARIQRTIPFGERWFCP